MADLVVHCLLFGRRQGPERRQPYLARGEGPGAADVAVDEHGGQDPPEFVDHLKDWGTRFLDAAGGSAALSGPPRAKAAGHRAPPASGRPDGEV